MLATQLPPPSVTTPRPTLSDDLVLHYMPRIRRHAARYARRLPSHVTVADLVSAGFAGLVDAFLRFDVARMESFEAYIDHRIRGAILDELRSHDTLTRDQRLFARRVAATTQRLTAALGRAPEQHEIAEAMEMSLAAFRTALWRASTSAACHAAPTTDDVSDVAGNEHERPDVLAESNQCRAAVQGAMERLPPRQQQVLRMYYQESLTLRQIAERFGVTESRVSQIHSEAIARLRALMAD
jgi:RNA polymerase sigma factor for flagellar operon FliA